MALGSCASDQTPVNAMASVTVRSSKMPTIFKKSAKPVNHEDRGEPRGDAEARDVPHDTPAERTTAEVTEVSPIAWPQREANHHQEAHHR